jgi:hypothetical protein
MKRRRKLMVSFGKLRINSQLTTSEFRTSSLKQVRISFPDSILLAFYRVIIQRANATNPLAMSPSKSPTISYYLSPKTQTRISRITYFSSS